MKDQAVIFVHTSDLRDTVRELNKLGDKIIAVTQYGNTYTIFYEIGDNKKEEPT